MNASHETEPETDAFILKTLPGNSESTLRRFISRRLRNPDTERLRAEIEITYSKICSIIEQDVNMDKLKTMAVTVTLYSIPYLRPKVFDSASIINARAELAGVKRNTDR